MTPHTEATEAICRIRFFGVECGCLALRNRGDMGRAIPAYRFVFGDECWAEIDGYRMRYLRAGRGRPVVLIHGLLGYSFSWRFNWEALAKSHSVYAPDLLGVGFSDWPTQRAIDFDLRDTALRMLGWMAGLNLQHAVLVGTSHGGALAMAMAAEALQRELSSVSQLVVVSGLNPWTTVGFRRVKLINSWIGAFLYRISFPLLVHGARSLMLGRMYGDPGKITDATVRGYIAPYRSVQIADYGLSIVRTWNEDLEYLRTALERLKRFPTMLIWGDKDRVVPPASGAKLHEVLENSKLEIMRGVGHLPYEESPGEFNRLLLEFLDSGENLNG